MYTATYSCWALDMQEYLWALYISRFLVPLCNLCLPIFYQRKKGDPLRVYMDLEASRKPSGFEDIFIGYHAKDDVQSTYAGTLFHKSRNYHVSSQKRNVSYHSDFSNTSFTILDVICHPNSVVKICNLHLVIVGHPYSYTVQWLFLFAQLWFCAKQQLEHLYLCMPENWCLLWTPKHLIIDMGRMHLCRACLKLVDSVLHDIRTYQVKI